MAALKIHRLGLMALVAGIVIFWVWGGVEPANSNQKGAVLLQAPVFLGTAYADASSPASFLEEEAGIAAYAQASEGINLAFVRTVFRTIEVETEEYIIGSVSIPNYNEGNDVHVYVNRDGWLLAYYPVADPVSKMVDWRAYTGGTIPSKLESALNRIVTKVGLTLNGVGYYHFGFPNATHLMLVMEQGQGSDSFQIELPDAFEYYERSWLLGYYGYLGSWTEFKVDGAVIKRLTSYGWTSSLGRLTADQLLPNVLHTVQVKEQYTDDVFGAIVLIYRKPQ